MPPKEEKYEPGDDDLIVEVVGDWVELKHKLLTDYIMASGGARRRHSQAAYIDVFCGPGRSRIRHTRDYIDGSSVAAFKKGNESLAPFTQIEISDIREDLLSAAETRLRTIDAPVRRTPGPAVDAVKAIVAKLNPHGLHLALLDPHNLGTLSFELFRAFAKLKHVDIIVHVSLSDLQRNADRYTSKAQAEFDTFAPGWREAFNHQSMNQSALRSAMINYWSKQVEGLGLPRAEHLELIKGSNNQRLYWLLLLARHPLAHDLWQKVSSAAKQHTLFD
jgi:three-Cys-motif partner protein